MSKKQLEYEHGLEQIMIYLEYSFQVNSQPTPKEILNEIESYPGLKGIPFEFVISDDHPVQDETPFFYMIEERYRRHDSALPDRIQIWKLPAPQAERKELYKVIRLQPVPW